VSSHSDLLAAQIQAAISHAIERGDLIGTVPANIPLERPKNRDHGDYASSIALQLAKPAGKKFPPLILQVLALSTLN
jgi:arginyl-tRNA synthetase